MPMKLPRTLRTATLVLAAFAAMPGAALAAPLNADGQAFRGAAGTSESPAGREHRAGIQAQLGGDRKSVV